MHSINSNSRKCVFAAGQVRRGIQWTMTKSGKVRQTPVTVTHKSTYLLQFVQLVDPSCLHDDFIVPLSRLWRRLTSNLNDVHSPAKVNQVRGSHTQKGSLLPNYDILWMHLKGYLHFSFSITTKQNAMSQSIQTQRKQVYTTRFVTGISQTGTTDARKKNTHTIKYDLACRTSAQWFLSR